MDPEELKLRKEFQARLKLLEYEYNKKIRQKCGQRIFGPKKGDKKPKPPKGSEIYVGHLQSCIFEDTLVPFFSQAGVIYKLRLMLEFSGLTRTFCFIMYDTPEMANRAVEMFHGLHFRGTRMCVYKSLDNCTLYLSGIPWHVDRKQILQELGARFKGIDQVEIKHIPNTHKLYAFVTFDSHQHAANARKIMWPDTEIWDNRIQVEWARPEKELVYKLQSTIYITNIAFETTRDEVIDYLIENVEAAFTKVVRVQGTNWAIIEFGTDNYAERAVKIITGKQWKGLILHASLANNAKCKKMMKSTNSARRPQESMFLNQGDSPNVGNLYNMNIDQSFENIPSTTNNFYTQTQEQDYGQVEKLPEWWDATEY